MNIYSILFTNKLRSKGKLHGPSQMNCKRKTSALRKNIAVCRPLQMGPRVLSLNSKVAGGGRKPFGEW